MQDKGYYVSEKKPVEAICFLGSFNMKSGWRNPQINAKLPLPLPHTSPRQEARTMPYPHFRPILVLHDFCLLTFLPFSFYSLE